MTVTNHLPDTVRDSLGARLAPFRVAEKSHVLEDLDVALSHAVEPRESRPRHGARTNLTLADQLKLVFAALGAGGSSVPLGDNGRAAHRLASYAQQLENQSS